MSTKDTIGNETTTVEQHIILIRCTYQQVKEKNGENKSVGADSLLAKMTMMTMEMTTVTTEVKVHVAVLVVVVLVVVVVPFVTALLEMNSTHHRRRHVSIEREWQKRQQKGKDGATEWETQSASREADSILVAWAALCFLSP